MVSRQKIRLTSGNILRRKHSRKPQLRIEKSTSRNETNQGSMFLTDPYPQPPSAPVGRFRLCVLGQSAPILAPSRRIFPSNPLFAPWIPPETPTSPLKRASVQRCAYCKATKRVVMSSDSGYFFRNGQLRRCGKMGRRGGGVGEMQLE